MTIIMPEMQFTLSITRGSLVKKESRLSTPKTVIEVTEVAEIGQETEIEIGEVGVHHLTTDASSVAEQVIGKNSFIY